MRPTFALTATAAAIGTLGLAGQALATSAPVVIEDEGNPTCSQVVANDVRELRDNSVVAGATETITDGIQTITYTVSDDGESIVEWVSTADPPIAVNFVIHRRSGNLGARLFLWGDDGVIEDSNEPSGGPLAQAAFCYDLETQVETEVFKDCPQGLQDALDELADTLDEDQIATIVPFGRTQGAPFLCVSGELVSTPCNPNTGTEDACDTDGHFAPSWGFWSKGPTNDTHCWSPTGGTGSCSDVTFP